MGNLARHLLHIFGRLCVRGRKDNMFSKVFNQTKISIKQCSVRERLLEERQKNWRGTQECG